jgi:hypothetical protein
MLPGFNSNCYSPPSLAIEPICSTDCVLSAIGH